MYEKIDQGSVITVVWGVMALAKVAAANPVYNARLFPYLLEILKTCIPRDVPTHGESMLPAVNAENRAAFTAALKARRAEMSKAQERRLNTVLKKLEVR